jgi:hypothetical protein
MTNLVKVTKETRIILKVGGIIFGALLLLYFSVKGGSIIRNIFFPKPPPPPKQEFGKLPHLSFTSQGTTGVQFRINTIDGQLPKLIDRVNIYKLVQPEADLLALKNAKNTLSSASFVENQIKLSDTLYQWSQTSTGVVIQYDIGTKNFTINSNYLTNPFLTTTNLIPNEKDIKSGLISFLASLNADTKDIDFDNSTVDLLQLQGGTLVKSENLGSAKFARITLVQFPVDKIPIIYDTPTGSILHFTVSYPAGNLQILDGQFLHHQPDLQNKSDYPIKTSTQAFEDLKNGNAYMINPLNLTNVDITNVEVRYYLDKNTNDYLLPIIVFTGINFTAYVDAIPNESLQQ